MIGFQVRTAWRKEQSEENGRVVQEGYSCWMKRRVEFLSRRNTAWRIESLNLVTIDSEEAIHSWQLAGFVLEYTWWSTADEGWPCTRESFACRLLVTVGAGDVVSCLYETGFLGVNRLWEMEINVAQKSIFQESEDTKNKITRNEILNSTKQ